MDQVDAMYSIRISKSSLHKPECRDVVVICYSSRRFDYIQIFDDSDVKSATLRMIVLEFLLSPKRVHGASVFAGSITAKIAFHSTSLSIVNRRQSYVTQHHDCSNRLCDCWCFFFALPVYSFLTCFGFAAGVVRLICSLCGFYCSLLSFTEMSHPCGLIVPKRLQAQPLILRTASMYCLNFQVYASVLITNSSTES